MTTEISDELFRDLTQAMRDADQAFQTSGGGTRHYLREVFLPSLDEHGVAVVRKWRPIDSAPKDGTSILIVDDDSDCPVVARFFQNGWEVSWDGTPFFSTSPIMWMEIPALPATPRRLRTSQP